MPRVMGSGTHPGLRVMDKVFVDENGCWIFTGYCNPVHGYGQISSSSRYGKSRTLAAHVATWMYFNGPVPEGLELDHLCRVRSCCNPGHLEPVTPLVNLQRGEHGPMKLKLAGVCAQGHRMTPENTYVNPGSGHRRCRICRDAARRQYRLEKGA